MLTVHKLVAFSSYICLLWATSVLPYRSPMSLVTWQAVLQSWSSDGKWWRIKLFPFALAVLTSATSNRGAGGRGKSGSQAQILAQVEFSVDALGWRRAHRTVELGSDLPRLSQPTSCSDRIAVTFSQKASSLQLNSANILFSPLFEAWVTTDGVIRVT